LLLLMYNTGARVSEAIGLRVRMSVWDQTPTSASMAKAERIDRCVVEGNCRSACRMDDRIGAGEQTPLSRTDTVAPCPLRRRRSTSASRHHGNCSMQVIEDQERFAAYASSHDSHAPLAIRSRCDRDRFYGGHESTNTTTKYVEADLELKRGCWTNWMNRRSEWAPQESDDLLDFLDGLDGICGVSETAKAGKCHSEHLPLRIARKSA